jgi:3-deoxy-D-manno-octulosonic-acid transferase
VDAPKPDPQNIDKYSKFFDRPETLLAASTHAGEEEQVLAGFIAARRTRPALRMILAPRHPRRSAEVAEVLRAAGLSFRTRSNDEDPDPATDVYLADTLGEMPLWYSLAGQCFVGGSLVSKGGHTPYEPAQFGCAILHGPSLQNFEDQYHRLAAMDGAILTPDATALGGALAGLDAERRSELARNAARALDLGGQSLDPLLTALAESAGLAELRTTVGPPSN